MCHQMREKSTEYYNIFFNRGVPTTYTHTHVNVCLLRNKGKLENIDLFFTDLSFYESRFKSTGFTQ